MQRVELSLSSDMSPFQHRFASIKDGSGVLSLEMLFDSWFRDHVDQLQNRFRASGPKLEKNRKNIGFGLPEKIGKK